MIEWYYGTEGQQQGPVDDATIRQLIAEGQINDSTLVWREGMVNWTPKAQVLELATAASAGGVVPYHPSMVAASNTSGLAIASLVCGIVSIVSCFIYIGGLTAIPAIICGHMAMNRIARSAEPMGGRGMAIAGLVTGYLGLLCQIVTIVFMIFFFTTFMNATSHSFPSPP